MHVIPVIDIRHGQAVRAIAGDRANYRPLVTPFAPTANPKDVANGLLQWHPFPSMYIADLDAIEGRGRCLDQATAVLGANPGLEIWLDNGATAHADLVAWLSRPRTVAVIGSETGVTPSHLQALKTAFGNRLVLSLDFRSDSFAGTSALLDRPACWPTRVIAMTLGRVGLGIGPDLERLAAVRKLRLDGSLYAAGGIRHVADLEAVRSIGVSGALVATAIHAKTITAGDLTQIAGRKF